MKKTGMNRRQFLARSIQAAVAGSSLTATLGQFNLVNAMVPDVSDYKALVCVFLFGGNDSYNLVVPADGPEYDAYADARQSLAVAPEELVPIAPLTKSGSFGFHPSAPALANLFDSGELAIVANVGALVEPVSRNSFKNETSQLPRQLFSHNDQQKYWQSLNTTGGQVTGWAGRMADLLQDVDGETQLSMNISIAGSNLWQTGSSTIPYSIGVGGVQRLNGLNLGSRGAQQRRRAQAFHALLDASPASIFDQEFATVQKRSIELADLVAEHINNAPALATQFPDGNPLGNSLSMVARLIAARGPLQVKRQTFFVALGGWDTHGEQLERHPILIDYLSQGLNAFQLALAELGVSNQVTTFTASDFGRTLTSNGDGSDHGWGSHQLVIGGTVNGQDIYGRMPVIEIDGPQDSGRGRIIPSTSIDEMGASLASWFGLGDSELNEAFPNLKNFAPSDMSFMRL